MKDEITINQITKSYLKSLALTQDKFASSITESLKNTEISRVSITNWVNGKSSPSTDFLLVCAIAYSDWRSRWAIKCLSAKLPEVFDSGMITFHLPKLR